MDKRIECIDALACALEDMHNSPLIYLDKSLSRVLKCLAYYGEFRQVLEQCNKNFDYALEKQRALVEVGDSNVLRLPKNKRQMVAFIVNLLLEFDMGGMDLIGFASKYFPAQTKAESIDKFFVNALDPFRFAIIDFVWSGVEEEPQSIERKVEYAHDGLSEQTKYLLVKMMETVKEAFSDTVERDKLVVMIEGISAALDMRDSLIIRAIWVGLEEALTSYGLCPEEVKKFREALRLYLVVK